MNPGREYAVTVTAREQAELLPIERDPNPLGPHEVAGRTLATLISAGTELASCYQGTRFPAVPGYAAVFEVEAVGSEVATLRPGDRAFCLGPHRSFQRVAEENALPLPEGLAPEVAVFARLMGVGMSTLTTTTARPPQKVVVTGLGLVGHLAAKIFASCGYEVLACDPSEARREMARQSGLPTVLSAVPLDDPAIAGKVALVLECSGHEAATLAGCRVVQKRGEVALVGCPWRRQTDLTAHELLDVIFHNYVVLRSGWEWELPLHPTDFRTNSIYGNYRAALRWLAEGRIGVEGLYALVPPREAQRAYQDLLHQRAERLAVVFDWGDCP
ncbi:MAG TPA: zinc-binding alcohol dehydrogenase [Chthonomonadaceae bacterium]|nr:zinc-binding alcohol dehydrogenase [Chthonomonadaceae bacterium]